MNRSFLKDRTGSVGIIFGLSLMPLLSLTGIALDYSRTADVKTQLQIALDVAALSVAKELPNLSPEEAKQRAQMVFDANFKYGAEYDFEDVTLVQADGTVTLSSRGIVPTTLTAALGFEELEVTAESQAGWGSGRIELALVLDNTLSMDSSDKMTELKKATEALLDELDVPGREPDAIRIGIVPFHTQVRLDAETYREKTWLYFEPAESSRDECKGKKGKKKKDCEDKKGGGRHGRGGGNNDDRGGRHDDDVLTRDDWEGCIGDRYEPADVSDTPAFPGDPDTGYWGMECEEDLADIHPLTDDFTALGATVDSMRPKGSTNVTIGIAWGHAILTPQEPLDESVPPVDEDDHLQRVMIVLTDGDNMQSRWSNDREEIDARTRLACEEVKDAGIDLYTVRVIDGNADLLEDCASEGKMYYDVRSASELLPAFRGIAREIANLRLIN